MATVPCSSKCVYCKKFTPAHFSHFKQDMGMLLMFPSHSGKKYVGSSGGPRKILAFDISPVGKLTYRFDCGGRLSAPWASMASNRFVTVSVTLTLIQKRERKWKGRRRGNRNDR